MIKSAVHRFLKFCKTHPYDAFIFVYLFFIPLIDSLNGILLHANLPSIAQPYKTFFIAIALIRILTFSRLIGILNLLFCLPFFIGDLLNAISIQDPFYLSKDFSASFKQLMFVVAISYFILFFKDKSNEFTKWYFSLILGFGFFIVATNLIVGAMGFGFPQYIMWTPQGQRLELGTTGFYYDGNSIAALLIFFGSYIAFWIWKNKPKFFLIFVSFLLLLAYFKATKVALIGPFILALSFPFFYERNHIFSFTKLKVRYTLFVFVFSLFVGPLLYSKVMDSHIGTRLSSMYNRVDLVTFILSDRNTFLQAGWAEYTTTFSTREIFLGRGYKSTEGPAAQSTYYGKNKTIELDFFDILFEKGLLGLLFSYGLFVVVTLISLFQNFFKRGNWLSPYIAFINVLFFALSFLSGHIVGSGLLGIYLGLINSLLFIKSPQSESFYD